MQLKQYLDETGMPLATLAEALGVSYDAVRSYYDGTYLPSWQVVARLKKLTHGLVTADDFLPELTEKRLRRRRVIDLAAE